MYPTYYLGRMTDDVKGGIYISNHLKLKLFCKHLECVQ